MEILFNKGQWNFTSRTSLKFKENMQKMGGVPNLGTEKSDDLGEHKKKNKA